MAEFTVWIPGVPRPQGSLKIVTSAATGQPFAKNSSALIEYRNFVVGEMRRTWGDRPPLESAVALTALFHLPRAKGHFGTGRNAGKLKGSAPAYPTTYPDLDKLLRAQGDALTIARVIADDSLVVDIRALKSYETVRGPGALVRVEVKL